MRRTPVLRSKVHCRSLSSIHILYNQALVGGLSDTFDPGWRTCHLQLNGGSTPYDIHPIRPPLSSDREQHIESILRLGGQDPREHLCHTVRWPCKETPFSSPSGGRSAPPPSSLRSCLWCNVEPPPNIYIHVHTDAHQTAVTS